MYALGRSQRRGCHWAVSYCRRVHNKRVAEPEPDRDMIWCSLCVYNIEPVAGLDPGSHAVDFPLRSVPDGL
jgi:hypothetical protein